MLRKRSRLLIALLLLGGVLALEIAQRSSRPTAAETPPAETQAAKTPAPQTAPGATSAGPALVMPLESPGAALPLLVPPGTTLTFQRTAGGFIPMPPDTPAAHASNLLAMPAASGAAVTAFWFAGERESAPDVQIVASQFDRATQQWLPAKTVVNRHAMGALLGTGIRRIGNPVAWLDASGRMHLFVVATGLGGWAAGRVLHTVQSSAGQGLAELELAPLRMLPLSWLFNTSYLVRSAPLPLADGGMVLPAYFELGIKYPVALRFDGRGEFVGMERISQRKHLLQPTLLATSATDWLSLHRDNRRDGRIAVARTGDGGAQWLDADDLALVNPDAAIAAMNLSPQHQVLVHNASPHSRALLDLSLSRDGLTWSRSAVLEAGTDADEYSYPALAWADGSLWVSYTDHRTRIAWQRFAVVASSGATAGVSAGASTGSDKGAAKGAATGSALGASASTAGQAGKP